MGRYKFDEIAINCTAKRAPRPEDYAKYIGLEHMDAGSIHIKRWGSSVPVIGEKLIMKKGDVLFGKRNTYLKRAAIAPFDGLFSAHGMVIRPKKEIMDEGFFPWFIASDYFFNEAIRISVGSLSPTVNWKDLKDLEFNIPGLNEQRRLANLLWVIDQTREEYIKLLELTDDLVKSQFIEMFGDPITNPRKLKKKRLGEMSLLITKGASPTWQGFKYTNDSTQTLFVTSENVREGWLDLSEKKYLEDGFNEKQKRSMLKKGDFLINIVGASIGRVARYELEIKANINQAVALVRVPQEVVNPDYLLMYLNSDKANEMYNGMKSAVARANLSLQDINDLEILLPERRLQDEYALFVQQTDKSKFEIKQSIENLTKMQKALINEVFA